MPLGSTSGPEARERPKDPSLLSISFPLNTTRGIKGFSHENNSEFHDVEGNRKHLSNLVQYLQIKLVQAVM